MAVQAQHQYSENLGLGFCGSSSQEWMENGCGGGGFNEQQLYLSLQQQQQQQQIQQQMMIQNQQQQQQQQQQQRILLNQNNLGGGGFGCNSDHQQVVSTSNNHQLQTMAFSQTLLATVEKQKQEIDRFVALQNERLRLALHEQRRQQLAVLLTSVESKAVTLLRQKDERLTAATKKSMELEACLRKAEMENQAWQRIAKENEAMVIALNNTLEQVKENACCFVSGAAEDTGSCCNFSTDNKGGLDIGEETGEGKAIDEEVDVEEEDDETMMKMVCKGCKSRKSCVLFLPCRHLCSCKSCEAFLSCCPVCKSVKKASIQVYMS